MSNMDIPLSPDQTEKMLQFQVSWPIIFIIVVVDVWKI